MQLKNTVWNFRVFRASSERRTEKISSPPYLTEEGMTLVDQRVKDDRRAEVRNTACNFKEEFNFS